MKYLIYGVTNIISQIKTPHSVNSNHHILERRGPGRYDAFKPA